MDVRKKNLQDYVLLDDNTIQTLMEKIFKNYQSWCEYLHTEPNLECPLVDRRQQSQLLYIALYLLIWGEASNIRFMPECICYIFHRMSHEMYGTLYSNVEHVIGATSQTTSQGEEAFLRDVVTPIYEVMQKEVRKNKNGKASHSGWRNYDDLNEYFRTEKCFKLGWPLDWNADFFVHSDVSKPGNKGNNQAVGNRKPKTNFVELRTFWHLYRSFDRMWIFFTSALQILPLIEPTKIIMNLRVSSYDWHEFFPNVTHNIAVVIAIWAPIVLIITLGMLRARFESVPSAFSRRLIPYSKEEIKQHQRDDTLEKINIAKFSQMWNEFILSMRSEDLISHREKYLLLVPYSSSDVSVVQWPPFLLASKIPIALDMAKDFKEKEDADLIRKIKNDDFIYFAIIECYETLGDLLFALLLDKGDRNIISEICQEVESNIQEKRFLRKFKTSGLPMLSEKLDKFLDLLMGDYEEDKQLYRSQIINKLQDIVEIIIQDVINNGHEHVYQKISLSSYID